MKTRTKRILIGVGAVVGALIVLRVAAAFIWPTQAVATTPVFRFKDDVTIGVGRDGQVNVHSRSRIGKGDLGANARRIRDFQARLGTRL